MSGHDVMAIALQSMQADALRMERVSANLANTMTPGYKREVGVQRSVAAAPTRFADLVAQQAAATAGDAAAIDTPLAAEVMRDMRVGTLKRTGQPFDLALAGPGFFEVATPSGPAYTRHGQFQLDARGRVVTVHGHALMAEGGELVLTATPVIDASGAVSENDRVVAKLRIVDFDRSGSLARADGGLYVAESANGAAALPSTVDATKAQIRQGFLENANVEPMREMVDLVRTMRRFESMQRAVQIWDDMLGTGIRKLGDV